MWLAHKVCGFGSLQNLLVPASHGSQNIPCAVRPSDAAAAGRACVLSSLGAASVPGWELLMLRFHTDLLQPSRGC